MDLRLLATGGEVGRLIASVATLAGDLRDWRSVRRLVPPESTNAGRDGYRLGEDARTKLRVPVGPLRDVEALFGRLGVHIARVSFESTQIDAASIWEPGAVPVVLLNLRSDRVRRNLTRRAVLAHELCHLLHDGGENDLLTQISTADEGSSLSEYVEQRARGFAPAFLAPRDQVWTWMRTEARLQDPRRIVTALARRWGFSRTGAIHHAKNCNLISHTIHDELLADQGFSVALEDDNFEATARSAQEEADAVDLAEIPDMWSGYGVSVVLGAYRGGRISQGRAREILSWT